jgi:hypothetical protein
MGQEIGSGISQIISSLEVWRMELAVGPHQKNLQGVNQDGPASKVLAIPKPTSSVPSGSWPMSHVRILFD